MNCPQCGYSIITFYLDVLNYDDSIPLFVKKIGKKFMFHNQCYKNLSSTEIKILKNTELGL
jgi:hypothetical protein